MPADGALAEALHRVEHKLDLLLEKAEELLRPTPDFLTRTPSSPKAVGDPNHICPVCKKSVRYASDLFQGVIVRQCGCGTGMLPLINLGAFAPPAQPAGDKHGRSGESIEDGNDSTSSGGRGGLKGGGK